MVSYVYTYKRTSLYTNLRVCVYALCIPYIHPSLRVQTNVHGEAERRTGREGEINKYMIKEDTDNQ